MKKGVIVCLVFGLLLFAVSHLSANGGSDVSAGSSEKEKVVWAAYGYLDQDKAGRIAAAFEEKYPQYEVEYVDLGNKDYIVRLDTMIASGERVDMALTMDFVDYSNRAAEGMFLPIEDYLTEDGFDLHDAFGDGIDASYIKGELYGLPYTKGGFYVFYNKDMFDAAGVPYPNNGWTWKEFEETAKKLTKGSGAEKIYGVNVHFRWGYGIETLPAQMAGWVPFKNDNTANLDDPRIKSALKMWDRMQNKDKSAISLATFKAEQIGSRMPFAEGDAAMLLSNWWSASWFINAKFGSAEGDKLLNFDFDVVNIPRPDSSVPDNLNATDLDWYYAVPVTAENPKGGALLARFIITDMHTKFGTLTSYKHQDLNEFKETFTKYIDSEGVEHVMNYSDDFVMKVMGNWTESIATYYKNKDLINPEGLGVIKDIYNQERELYYLGEQTLDETVKRMQERAQAELDSMN